MDSIRLSQVNEALNYDKNINAMVFNLEKKRTAMFPDAEVLPYSQIGEETMTTTKEGANSLKVTGSASGASLQPSGCPVHLHATHPADKGRHSD